MPSIHTQPTFAKMWKMVGVCLHIPWLRLCNCTRQSHVERILSNVCLILTVSNMLLRRWPWKLSWITWDCVCVCVHVCLCVCVRAHVWCLRECRCMCMLTLTHIQSMISPHLFNQNRGHILPTLGYNEFLQATSNLQIACSRKGSNTEQHITLTEDTASFIPILEIGITSGLHYYWCRQLLSKCCFTLQTFRIITMHKCAYCIHVCQCVKACNSIAMRQMACSVPVAHTSTYWSTLELKEVWRRGTGSQTVTWKVRRRGWEWGTE